MKSAEVKVIHLDSFPYGGYNRVKFMLGEVDITEPIATILSAYWVQFCDSDSVEIDAHGSAIIQTGESFAEEDFRYCIEDIIALRVVSVLHQEVTNENLRSKETEKAN